MSEMTSGDLVKSPASEISERPKMNSTDSDINSNYNESKLKRTFTLTRNVFTGVRSSKRKAKQKDSKDNLSNPTKGSIVIQDTDNNNMDYQLQNKKLYRRPWSKILSKIVQKVSTLNVQNNKNMCSNNYMYNSRRRYTMTSLSSSDIRVPPTKPIHIASSDKVPGVMGLRNHGNTCFINAVLQCLSHTDLLAEYFVLDMYKADLSRRNKLNSKKYGTKGEVTEQLALLLKAIWSCQYDPEMSNKFKLIVDKYGSQYRGNNQHDAQEFLLWLLDKVHEDLNTATKKKYKVIKLCLLLSSLNLICDHAHALLKGLNKITDSLNVATEDFKTLVESGIYVDKSLMINETLMCDEKVMQITRPRKWGKTINLSMLKRFFDLEHDRNGNPLPDGKKVNPPLFKGGKVRVNGKVKTLNPLKVSGLDDVMSHMGKHPVIYIDLKDVKGKNYQQFEEQMRNLIADLYLSFSFLNKYLDDGSDTLDVPEKIRLAQFVTKKVKDEDFVCCFEFLSLLLYKHFKSEVCLFIDNYDYPIINAYLEFGDKNREFDSIVIMLRVLFENAFKENQYMLKGILAGTLNFFVVASGISQYDFVGFHTLLDEPFSNHYGFTQKDIGELMGRADMTFNLIQLRQWYGGIHVHGQEIFNPWSVMKCLSKRGKYDYYLQNSYSTDFSIMMARAFQTEDMQEYFHLLIEGREIVRSTLAESVYLRSVSGDFYSVFVHAGILERIAPEKPTDRPIWRMKIPNLDVKGVFSMGVGKWVAQELKLVDSQYERFINLLPIKQLTEFANQLQHLLAVKYSDRQPPDEEFYHRLMGGLVCSLGMKYFVEIIKDSGKMRGGVALSPLKDFSKDGFVIEYQIHNDKESINKTADSALENILKSPRSFAMMNKNNTDLRTVCYLAIVFCDSNVVVRFKEDKVQ